MAFTCVLLYKPSVFSFHGTSSLADHWMWLMYGETMHILVLSLQPVRGDLIVCCFSSTLKVFTDETCSCSAHMASIKLWKFWSQCVFVSLLCLSGLSKCVTSACFFTEENKITVSAAVVTLICNIVIFTISKSSDEKSLILCKCSFQFRCVILACFNPEALSKILGIFRIFSGITLAKTTRFNASTLNYWCYHMHKAHWQTPTLHLLYTCF